MKKTLRIVVLLNLIFICCMFCYSTNSFAVDTNKYAINDYSIDGTIQAKAGTLIGILQVVGIIIAVIGIGILGIKFILGSVEEKADYKKSMIPYIIGIALIVCTTTIVNVIYQITTNATM